MAGRGMAGGGGGARIPRPMYEPINTSAPSPADLELDGKLEAFMDENVPVMTKADLRRREQVLGKIRTIFLQVCVFRFFFMGVRQRNCQKRLVRYHYTLLERWWW